MAEIINKEQATVAVGKLRPHPANPRQGDVGAIYESIRENGFYGTIVVQKSTGYVLAGNHRLKAAQEAGIDAVPVVYVDVDDDRAIRILLADNRTNDVASYNEDALADLLEHLASTDAGLAGTGYDGDALDDLLKDLGRLGGGTEEPEAKVDQAEQLREKWGVDYGDLWQIGRHRLLCGDSTNADDVARLLDGAKPTLMVTDPPYGIKLDTDYSGMGSTRTSYRRIVGDDKPFDMKPIFNVWPDPESAWVWGGDYLRDTLPDGGSYTVWAKAHSEDENRVFGSAYEIVWTWPARKRELWFIRRIHMTDEHLGAHPTQKPVECMQRPIRNHPGDVYDPFVGSGATMVAAENEGRTCYAMEIDPGYVAVCLERLSDMGLEPKRVDQLDHSPA